MQKPSKTTLGLALSAFVLTAPALPAFATQPICAYHPPEQWMPVSAVEAKAESLGITDFYVQPEGGCWGIYSERNGANWLTLIDPVSGDVVRDGPT